MRQRRSSPVTLTLVLLLSAVVPPQASAPPQPAPPPAGGPPRPQPVQTVTVTHVPLELFNVPAGLEVTLWAETPMLRNPTNMDIDRDGRIWVAEGVRYRSHHARQPEGDRIVVLEDRDKDGTADKQWTFVQEVDLVAPLGVAVIDNKVVVSQPPDLIVYTDVDRDLRFDPAVDTREVHAYNRAHIPGAVHIPMEEIETRLAELHMLPGEPILYCRAGDKTKVIADTLSQSGVPMSFLENGFLGWEAEGLPIERPD